MSWFFYLMCVLVVFVAGVFLGTIWTEKSYEKHSAFMIRYMGLTEKSKKMVNGYLKAREANDERTTYRERH